MKHSVFILLLCIAVGLIASALSTTGKEGMLIFFLGVATLLCTLAVAVLRSKSKTPTTNVGAILGASVGVFLGGFVGASTGFGRVMISIFNPRLPERDFAGPFGAIGGAILGAIVVALLGSILQSFFLRTKNDTGEDSR